MKWPIVGESGASNGGHQRVQIASENIVIILIYGYSIIYVQDGLVSYISFTSFGVGYLIIKSSSTLDILHNFI